MGSRWEDRPTEEERREVDFLSLAGTTAGLGAAELDLLRSAPDYDAEEMATVRPMGGWPGSLSTSPPLEPPASPSWVPPNRIEPPVRGPLPADETIVAAPYRSHFPEERTVALMAEDLLGRPLDEPDPAAAVSVAPTGAPRSAGSASGTGADVWDHAMPLLVESGA